MRESCADSTGRVSFPCLDKACSRFGTAAFTFNSQVRQAIQRVTALVDQLDFIIYMIIKMEHFDDTAGEVAHAHLELSSMLYSLPYVVLFLENVLVF